MPLEEVLTSTVDWKEDGTNALYQLQDVLKFACKEGDNLRNTSARVTEFQTGNRSNTRVKRSCRPTAAM
jgi:hypothetical protein